jgi:hypothetical protein
VLDDCVTTAMPQDSPIGWHVTAGLYDLVSGARLPVQDAQGKALSDGQVTVEP